MSANLTLIGSYTSPFVRITRVVLAEMALDYDMDVTTFFAKNTPEQEAHILEHNPLMKIPVLIHGEHTVFDSRIIASYLLKNFKPQTDFRTVFPASVQEDNIVTTLSGVLDAAVLYFIFKTTQAEVDRESGYLARSLERAHSGLSWLDKQSGFGTSFGVSEALLICALDWLKKREVLDWSTYKHLVSIHEKYAARPSLVSTRIPESV